MATKANIIKVYAQADSAKKVDIIIRYYPNFMGIVESQTDGLRYMIENEKAFNRTFFQKVLFRKAFLKLINNI